MKSDGSESDWGRVTEWDPFGQVRFQWYPGREPETALVAMTRNNEPQIPTTPIKTNLPRRRSPRTRPFNVEAKIGPSRGTISSAPTLKSRFRNNRYSHPDHAIGKLVLSVVVRQSCGLFQPPKPSWRRRIRIILFPFLNLQPVQPVSCLSFCDLT